VFHVKVKLSELNFVGNLYSNVKFVRKTIEGRY